MPWGFIRWYETDWSARRAAERVEGFEAAGWSLCNSIGEISMLSNEWESAGDRLVIDRATLLRSAALDNCATEFNFQYWHYPAEHSDILCEIRRVDDSVVVQGFLLDGHRAQERDEIVADVLSAAVAAGSTLGLVVDRWGQTEDVDWDAVITRGRAGHRTARPAWPGRSDR